MRRPSQARAGRLASAGRLLQPFAQEELAVAWRIVLQLPEHHVTALQVEFDRLETVRFQRGLRRSAFRGEAFRGVEQPRALALTAQPRMYPQEPHVQPVAPDVASAAAQPLAGRILQK